jgi:hypothetical protein
VRRIFSILLIFAIIISLAGCSEEWRRKFIRKKKDVTKKPRIYQLKKYKKEPNEQLYSKHYNYCITWLSELAEDIGQNSKKDARCIEEALGQIKDMQNILIPEKARELDKHIARLKEVQDLIIRQDMDQANKDYVQRSIEREERFLRSEFYYHKIKNCMKDSFEEEES